MVLVLTAHISAVDPWWLDEPVRLIQTNLREIDARDFDVEVYVEEALVHSANTVLINVGGIVANYPTDLEFHYRNPFLRFDIIHDVVERSHESKIRVIGRFDFSKINEKFADQNPACKRIDTFVRNGGKVLATAETSTRDELGALRNRFRLRAAGVKPEFKVHEKARGTYLRVFPEDKPVLGGSDLFADLDILYVWGDFLEFNLEPGASGHLGLIPGAMYGPPEKCYYTEVTRIPGLVGNHFGRGRFAYLPWPVGEMYEHRSHHGHRAVVKAAMSNVLGYKPQIEVVASPLLEVAYQSARDGSFEWIGLANHTGQLGTAFHAPIPLNETVVNIGVRKSLLPAAFSVLVKRSKRRLLRMGHCISRSPNLRTSRWLCWSDDVASHVSRPVS